VIVDNPEDRRPPPSASCPDTIEPPLGPSFDDLVRYLDGLPLIDISENTDVTLDGYRGKYLKYTWAHEFECYGGPGRIGHIDVWILDVDGVRLVINAISSRAPSETAMAELRQMVESIHIER